MSLDLLPAFFRDDDEAQEVNNACAIRTIEHWAPLIRHAAEVAPDYFFARTGLVKLLVREGKLDEARAELAPLLELKEMHSSEWRSLILAQISIAKAEADLPTLKRLNAMLRDCQERFG